MVSETLTISEELKKSQIQQPQRPLNKTDLLLYQMYQPIQVSKQDECVSQSDAASSSEHGNKNDSMIQFSEPASLERLNKTDLLRCQIPSPFRPCHKIYLFLLVIQPEQRNSEEPASFLLVIYCFVLDLLQLYQMRCPIQLMNGLPGATLVMRTCM